MNWYLKVLKQYADFNGRARRKEYWMFFLFNMIFSLVLTYGGMAMGMGDTTTGQAPLIANIYSLAVLLPSIAVAVRRMHDVGKSGWFCLIPFYNLYLAVTDSEPGSNQYGPNPKNEGDQIEDHLITS